MYIIEHERPHAAADIEALLDQAFGPARRSKAVYRLRDGVAPIGSLCFTLSLGGSLCGTIRFWPASLDGRGELVVLGPVAVAPGLQGLGLGAALIRHSLAAAGDQGHGFVALVGDQDYYRRFGFSRAAAAGLRLPGLKETDRLLALALSAGDGLPPTGRIGPRRCLRAA